jgi:hypothetical protein
MAATRTPRIVTEHACTLLSGTFAMLIQLTLAATAVITLVYKRSHEQPRRPWLVWFFDTSKQAFAGALQHAVNLGFGIVFATFGSASECSWYFVNFSISVVCGVMVLWAFMVAYEWCVERYQLTLLRSGEYGSPPSWRAWLAQLLVWGFFSSLEKFITAIVVILPLHEHLDTFAAWIETPLAAYPATELVTVMVIAPVALNVAFFWVVDNLIMRKRRVGTHGDGQDDHQPHDDKQPLLHDDGCECPQWCLLTRWSATDYSRPSCSNSSSKEAPVTAQLAPLNC